jgi:delta1-piperideine-2-carboxylate reductase
LKTTDPQTALSLTDIESLACEVLLANGCDSDNASALSPTITAAERDGCESHGLFRIPGYVASLRSGKVRGDASPSITGEQGRSIRVDGDGGFTPLALERSLPTLAEAAMREGIAALAIRNTFHFAALWHETEALAEQGLCALACVNYAAVVAPHGGTQALFGTNPISFAWPRPGGTPVVFDMATSAMARGDIQIAARDGQPVPTGVGLDSHGEPSTDPAEILNGVQLPFGGHKGSALALMVELLAAGMTGEPFGPEAADDVSDGGPPRGGEFIIAMAPELFAGESWDKRPEDFLQRFEAMDGARLPGERRHRMRADTGPRAVNTELLGTIESLRHST